ncbi:MAG: OmpA family protein [Acetobacteraceae bacterium]|nr:OmpA family protein [Acetobacteraceae bacterium]
MLTTRPFLTLGLLAATAMPASAQVTLDLHALDQLKGGKSATPSHPAAKRPAAKHADKTQHPKQAPKEDEQAGQSAAVSTPPGPTSPAPKPPSQGANPGPTNPGPPPAVLPVAVPPPVRLDPVAPEPATGKPAVPVKSEAPLVSADAGGALEPISEGVRLTFAGGRTDLNPASEAGLKSFVEAAPKTERASYNVLAFAPGTPEDPSTPRRLSLSRALAVRSVLMAEGVPSARIYVRALGGTPTDGPPDRVDVTVSGGTGP